MVNHMIQNTGQYDILIVDDTPDSLELLGRILVERGYRVRPTSSGRFALESVAARLPDLILLDVKMPEMDGFEVCRRLKSDAHSRNVPVIFISAQGGTTQKLEGFKAGGVDYITKPFEREEVLARVAIQLRLNELTERLEQQVDQRTRQIQQEIVEHKRTEQELRASENKYRVLFNSTNDAVFVHSVIDDHTRSGRFNDVNDTACIRYGYTKEEFLKMPPEHLAAEDQRGKLLRILKRLTAGKPTNFEMVHVAKDGARIPVEVSANIIEMYGKRVVYSIARDITERKRAEEARQRAFSELEDKVVERTAELAIAREQAEAANAAKSDFLARMSHDIRTPLNAVTGLTSIVLKTELTAEQHDYLNKVQLAGSNLLQVINDILDFSKVEAGRLNLEHHPFKLDQLLEQMADLFSYGVAKKDLELIFALDPNIPRHLTGDKARLIQVLTNLVANAVKFTETGEIVVGVEPDDQAEKLPEQAALKFTISDTGIGVAADVLPTLFEPFTQADSYLTRKHEGTGLGLAICQRLVELMGGRIWAESTPGQGSTFSFTLRLDIHKEKRTISHLPTSLQGVKALVVDDSATARRVLVDHLESFTFNVDAVDCGEKAIKALHRSDQGEAYQLVFLDWKMDGMDGIETATTIRNDPNLHHPPIIILVTAYGQELLQEGLDKAAVDTFLLKPVKPSQLLDTVMTLLGHEKAMAPLHPWKPAELPIQRLAGRRVLVVEDSELNREVAVALLKEAGLTVETAENGQVAVEKVTKSPKDHYDVVLMDIQMPIMNGYQASRKIREFENKHVATSEQPQARTPIIALTAHVLKGEKEKCMAADMDDYLSKPLDEQNLHQVLLKWVAS